VCEYNSPSVCRRCRNIAGQLVPGNKCSAFTSAGRFCSETLHDSAPGQRRSPPYGACGGAPLRRPPPRRRCCRRSPGSAMWLPALRRAAAGPGTACGTPGRSRCTAACARRPSTCCTPRMRCPPASVQTVSSLYAYSQTIWRHTMQDSATQHIPPMQTPRASAAMADQAHMHSSNNIKHIACAEAAASQGSTNIAGTD